MATTIDIKDTASAAIARVRESIRGKNLLPIIGRAEVGMFQAWLANNGTNKRGWPSTGFWASAARATNFSTTADSVKVSINKQGVRQRYQGGVIKPTGGRKFLTIPARQEAYGRRAREFNNLRLVFLKNGGAALVEADASAVKFGRKRKDGTRKVTAQSVGGGVMFWLKRSVRQEADPSVLPPKNIIVATAMEVIEDAVDRATRRAAGGGATT